MSPSWCARSRRSRARSACRGPTTRWPHSPLRRRGAERDARRRDDGDACGGLVRAVVVGGGGRCHDARQQRRPGQLLLGRLAHRHLAEPVHLRARRPHASCSSPRSRACAHCSSLPRRAGEWRLQQRERAAQAALREALAMCFSGRYSRAHKAAQRALLIQSETPSLADDTRVHAARTPARGRQPAPLAGPHSARRTARARARARGGGATRQRSGRRCRRRRAAACRRMGARRP